MIKFNPDSKQELPFKETLGPLSKIFDPQEAKEYFEAYVAYLEKKPNVYSRDQAVQQALTNIEAWARHFCSETTRDRILNLFVWNLKIRN